mmetsp:Transcript_66699/g.192686  ORF Transcript_66699/g.192686 Transcript_66699/m.192686 type:complete len:212 (-) Transcript_66699:931-1566(-)
MPLHGRLQQGGLPAARAARRPRRPRLSRPGRTQWLGLPTRTGASASTPTCSPQSPALGEQRRRRNTARLRPQPAPLPWRTMRNSRCWVCGHLRTRPPRHDAAVTPPHSLLRLPRPQQASTAARRSSCARPRRRGRSSSGELRHEGCHLLHHSWHRHCRTNPRPSGRRCGSRCRLTALRMAPPAARIAGPRRYSSTRRSRTLQGLARREKRP